VSQPTCGPAKGNEPRPGNAYDQIFFLKCTTLFGRVSSATAKPIHIPRAGGKLGSQVTQAGATQNENDDDGRCHTLKPYDYASGEEEKNAVTWSEI